MTFYRFYFSMSAFFIGLIFLTPSCQLSGSQTPTYRLPIQIGANGFERVNKVVILPLDLNSIAKDNQGWTAPDPASVHLKEVDGSGSTLAQSVPVQFDWVDEKTGMAEITFLLEGKTGPSATRNYYLSFDGKPSTKAATDTLVSIEPIGMYKGENTYKVNTPTADWYYHITSAGFASLMDKDGNDWISYEPNEEPADGSRGRYRGIPNVAPINYHPGRPEGKKPGRILAQGPLRVSLLSESEDGQWRSRWDVYPDYAEMTLLEKGPEPFWILYEGTPGGKFNEDDYWVRSDGTRESMKPYHMSKNQWTGHLPSPKWVYFGDHELERVMYFIHHEDYPYEDVFWHFGEGGMTVFGFGRGPDSQENWQQLTGAPAHLTVGFSEVNEFGEVKETIDGAYRALSISMGTLEAE